MTTHSLTFDDIEEYNRIQALVSGDRALPFGSEIEIEEPLSLNMKIDTSLDGKSISRRRQQQLNELRKFSILRLDEDIVVPITRGMAGGDNYRMYKYSTRNPLDPVATAEVSPIFPFDLGFAMTVHKAQGRTIDRVVLDLTCFPTTCGRMEFAAVFVAMSRVRSKEHIRLLKHRQVGFRHDAAKAYSYLSELRPDKYVMAFYHGFLQGSNAAMAGGGGLIWNPRTSLDYSP